MRGSNGPVVMLSQQTNRWMGIECQHGLINRNCLRCCRQKIDLLFDVEDGLRAGILDLAALVGVEDEPRFKWIRLEIVRLQDQVKRYAQTATP